MPKIDPTAKVHKNAQLADDVVVGPFSIVDEFVRIGPGTVIESHCVVTGHTEMSAKNHIFPNSCVGTPPQDHSYRGEPTRLLIGDGNHIREFVTLNTGTVKGGGITIIGNHNLFMACSHVGHDCVVGDRTVFSNCALLAGHVKVEDGVILSGHAAVHQFVTLGTVSMLGGLTGVMHDVPPYMIMLVDHRVPRGVNIVGMKRNGFSDVDIRSVQRAYRLLYRSGLSRKDVAKELEGNNCMTTPVANLLAFIERSEKGKLGRFLESTRLERGGTA